MADVRKDVELYKISEFGCWLFLGSKSHNGYGQMKRNGKHLRAHRYFYEKYIGSIQKGEIVRHKCDTPACVNPNHLLTGTYKQNTADALRRDRFRPVKGEAHVRALFTDAQISEMRLMYKNGITQTKIAELFGTYQATISGIVRNIKRKSYV